MHQLTLRERLGIGVAVTVVLTLGVGSCAYSHNSFAAIGSGPALAPSSDGHPVAAEPNTANSAGASLDLPAGGGGASASPAATGAAGTVSPVPPTPASLLMVHVVGAVKKPGVYRLKPGARLCDAVQAAGGFTTGAQQDVLNLADTVRDADQVYVPRRDELSTAPAALMASAGGSAAFSAPPRRPRSRRSYIVRGMSPGQPPLQPIVLSPPRAPLPGIIYASGGAATAGGGGSITVAPGATAQTIVLVPRVLGRPDTSDEGQDAVEEASTVAASPFAKASKRTSAGRSSGAAKSGSSAAKKFKNPGDGVVNINTASPIQLMFLPGVGESTAQKILEYRAQIGRFTSITQIMDVKGIGPKKFERMRLFLAL